MKPVVSLMCIISLGCVSSQMPASAADEVREVIVPAFEYPIGNVPGKKMTALLVSYAPGAKTPAHLHGQAFVVGYVLEGSIRSKVDDGEAKVFRAGESWTENPGARHQISENASASEPAKLLAVLVSDAEAKDLFTLQEAHPVKK